MKNISASVYTRLRNHARDTGVDMQTLLARYVQERLLYRLSVSPESERFCLKGGLLIAAYNDGNLYRPTEDIDFNGFDTNGTIGDLEEALSRVLSVQVEDDGVTFVLSSMRVLKDRDEGIVPGGKVLLSAAVHTARVDLKVDVGFGNAVTPDVRLMEIPTLLGGSVPRPMVNAYPLETVIAEKLHAMAQFGSENTRIKDHYDILMLSRNHSFDGMTLADAITKTFTHQRRPIPERFACLGEDYADDNARKWGQFTRKVSAGFSNSFADAIDEINALVAPVIAAARGEGDAPCLWRPGEGWGEPTASPRP